MAKTTSETYQKLTQIEHVLQRPEMYIGSTVTELKKIFIIDNIESFKIIEKLIHYNPGFFKLYDEILTNASDHFIRTGQVKYIKVNVDKESISIENDGPEIPIEIHEKEKIYIPELIFGNLLTGSNFDESENRTWGGRNGIGAKATNIFSKLFIVETANGKNKYVQKFHDNLSVIDKPTITKSTKNYTKITFFPDFTRFGMDEIDEETKSLFLKRAVDIATYCNKIKVHFNEKVIPIKSFKDYMEMFVPEGTEFFSEKINDNWEIGITKSKDENFNQVSMVNGIATIQGGTHVNHITNQIIKGVQEILAKKYKGYNIKQSDIKNNLFVFVNCKIANPTFDTQTKETLTNKINSTNTDANVSDKFIKQLSQSKIVEDIVRFIEAKEKAGLAKASGKKTTKVKVKKLDDANRAGTSESDKCYLLLSEGDSAKEMCIAGFSSVGRDYFGVFPLKGKPLNVRDELLSKIKENEEIKNVIAALGLEFNKKYTTTKDLRYGKIVLMTDADCIDENTYILTKRGYVLIKDINYEDVVLTHTGEYKQVLNIIKTKKDKLVEIKINGEVYSFGENHKIPILRDGQLIEICAKDIKTSDKMLKRKF